MPYNITLYVYILDFPILHIKYIIMVFRNKKSIEMDQIHMDRKTV